MADDTLQRLAADTAQAMHDLNNLLMVIIGNADLLAEDVTANPSQRENVAEILKAALRAQEISDTLHARSRGARKPAA